MNENRLPDYLDHMQQAATDACSFVKGQAKDQFLVDKRTQRAVVMSLIILGEAATKVMDRYADFAQAHPEVPWRSMRRMRNRIAHGYFDINLDVVWDTAPCKRRYRSYSNNCLLRVGMPKMKPARTTE
ncbi:HepT-like ribonuclease domain-containing protein [Paraburkholderia youngii]|uniref:HepT-like ribonuclease domain-containing protein n=1 Tax=Paraburkholderia youngii TaxID=2782701 RepID=UPI003F62DC82